MATKLKEALFQNYCTLRCGRGRMRALGRFRGQVFYALCVHVYAHRFAKECVCVCVPVCVRLAWSVEGLTEVITQ